MDAANRSAGADRYIFALPNYWQKHICGLRLCSDHAAVKAAKPAIDAGRTRNSIGVCIGFAESCSRPRVGMVAERFGGIAEKRSDVRNLRGWRGIFQTAPPFKDVAAIDAFSA